MMITRMSRGAAGCARSARSASRLPLGAQAAGLVRLRQRRFDVFVRVMPSRGARSTRSQHAHARAGARAARLAGVCSRCDDRSTALLPRQRRMMLGSVARVVRRRCRRAGSAFSAAGAETRDGGRREGDFIQYFAYPSIIAVDPESPAQRAGIVTGDVLIAYNGLDVRGTRVQSHAAARARSEALGHRASRRRNEGLRDDGGQGAGAGRSQRRLEFDAMPEDGVDDRTITKGDDGAARHHGMGAS